VNSVVANRKRS